LNPLAGLLVGATAIGAIARTKKADKAAGESQGFSTETQTTAEVASAGGIIFTMEGGSDEYQGMAPTGNIGGEAHDESLVGMMANAKFDV